MSSPTTPLNLIPAEPSLKDLLDLVKRDVFLSLVCHHVGTIQSFDATKQTASATINYKKTIYVFNTVTKQYAPTLVDYPQVIDCPVIFIGGGSASLTMPVNKGDECFILFNDRSIDNWFTGASGAALSSARAHSFSDGIILVGARSQANVIQNFDTARAVLRNGNAMVGVGTELVKIANEVTSLKTVINGLIDQIKALVTVGSSITQTISPASQTALDTYKSTVGGLLE